MIASIFRKSTPINYLFVLIATLFFYFFYVMNHGIIEKSAIGLVVKGVTLVLFLASLFVVNFMVVVMSLNSKDRVFIEAFLVQTSD